MKNPPKNKKTHKTQKTQVGLVFSNPALIHLYNFRIKDLIEGEHNCSVGLIDGLALKVSSTSV